MLRKHIILVIGMIVFAHEAWSNEEDTTDLDLIEAEINSVSSPKKGKSLQTPDMSSNLKSNELVNKFNIQNPSELYLLEGFQELAIIQPRFQPKVGRFQLHGGAGGILNDPWYSQMILSGRAGYHLNDQWGVELTGMTFSGGASASSKDLESQLNVLVSSLVRVKSYFGANAFFSPMYGKMSLFNKQIIPFDVFFLAGVGQSQMEGSKDQAVITYQVGMGQLFSLSRNLSLRWDILVNFFQARGVIDPQANIYQTILLNFGVSYFLPQLRKS